MKKIKFEIILKQCHLIGNIFGVGCDNCNNIKEMCRLERVPCNENICPILFMINVGLK